MGKRGGKRVSMSGLLLCLHMKLTSRSLEADAAEEAEQGKVSARRNE